jgi:hypothetical protein
MFVMIILWFQFAQPISLELADHIRTCQVLLTNIEEDSHANRQFFMSDRSSLVASDGKMPFN